jgi:hypothetical protein
MQHRHSFPTALCTLALAGLLATTAAASEPEPTPQARAHFKAGYEFLKAESWPEAYREFKAAYAITPKWTALGNLGIAAEHLERDGEAIDAMQEYLERGGAEISAKEEKLVRKNLERLRGGIATVTLEAAGTMWIVDTRLAPEGPIVNQYGPFEGSAELRVRAGQHEFRLERSDANAPAWSVALLPGDTSTHSFAVEPDPELVVDFETSAGAPAEAFEEDIATPRSHTASYVLWGTGAVAAVTGTVFWLESNRLQNNADKEFAQRCPLGAATQTGCENRTSGDEKAATWRSAALVTGIGALGAIVTGTVLYWLDDSSAAERRGQAEEASVRPWVNPTGIGISGTF